MRGKACDSFEILVTRLSQNVQNSNDDEGLAFDALQRTDTVGKTTNCHRQEFTSWSAGQCK